MKWRKLASLIANLLINKMKTIRDSIKCLKLMATMIWSLGAFADHYEKDSIFYHLYQTDNYGSYYVDDYEGSTMLILNIDSTYVFVDMNLGESDAGKLVFSNDTIHAISNDSVFINTMSHFEEYCNYFPINKLHLKIKKYSNERIRIEGICERRELIDLGKEYEIAIRHKPLRPTKQKRHGRKYIYTSESSSVYSIEFGIVRLYDDMPNCVFILSREFVTIYRGIKQPKVSDCQIVHTGQLIGQAKKRHLNKKYKVQLKINAGHNLTYNGYPVKLIDKTLRNQ